MDRSQQRRRREEEERRRASFSVFPLTTPSGRRSSAPRASLTASSPRPSLCVVSRSARASFSRSPRGSGAGLDAAASTAFLNLRWSPILSGSRYAVHRASTSRSSGDAASAASGVIITIETAGNRVMGLRGAGGSC